jgi:hypothetical protein
MPLLEDEGHRAGQSGWNQVRQSSVGAWKVASLYFAIAAPCPESIYLTETFSVNVILVSHGPAHDSDLERS